MAATTVKFNTGGMHCSSCPMLIEMTVGDLVGVVEVSADYRTLITEVTFDPDDVSWDEIVEAMEEIGYTAESVLVA